MNTMRESRCLLFAALTALSVLVASPARAAEHIKGEIKVCISPGSNCSGFDTAYFGGGSLSVKVRNQGYDDTGFDYTVEFDNRSRCEITIGTTMMRHGRTLNAQTLDFGNIDLAPGESRESGERRFSPSREESQKYEFVKFTYSGLASCPSR